MLTFGRLAALAASVERATRQEERTHRLDERSGSSATSTSGSCSGSSALTLALGAEGALTDEERQTCHDELQEALGDLRSALGRPTGSEPRPTRTTLRELVDRRAQRTPELAVDWREGVEVPEAPRGARAVGLPRGPAQLREARAPDEDRGPRRRRGGRVRARGHQRRDQGRRRRAPGSACGCSTLEALQHDALVEFGPLPGGTLARAYGRAPA